MKSYLVSTLGIVAAFLITVWSAHAGSVSGQGTWETTLQARDLDGDASTAEAYYDTVLDITWLADANYAQTSGYDSDGMMTWEDANAWATGLNINGITGWRLPTVSPINGTSWNIAPSCDGTTDEGVAMTTTDGSDGGWRDGDGNPVSEMGHMFYVNLGNVAGWNLDCSVMQPSGLSNTGPFLNMKEKIYWYGTETDYATDKAMLFLFQNGGTTRNGKMYEYYAWAVHPGNVGVPAELGPVPKPKEECRPPCLEIDPLALVLRSDIYINLTLPDPQPIDFLTERIHTRVKKMSVDERRSALAQTKRLRLYLDILEKELTVFQK